MSFLEITLILFILHRWYRSIFKIAYYEKKLETRGVDISSVQDMSWWKLWVN
jgi:hypothetical protein